MSDTVTPNTASMAAALKLINKVESKGKKEAVEYTLPAESRHREWAKVAPKADDDGGKMRQWLTQHMCRFKSFSAASGKYVAFQTNHGQIYVLLPDADIKYYHHAFYPNGETAEIGRVRVSLTYRWSGKNGFVCTDRAKAGKGTSPI